MDLVKGYWTRAFGGQTKAAWTLRDTRRPAVRQRRRVLAPRAARRVRRGHVDARGDAARRDAGAGAARGRRRRAAPPAPVTTGMEIVFRPDPNILDGRFANNGWLQELPKPLSKVTWDNVAYISPKTAERLGIPVVPRRATATSDVIEIRYQGRSARRAGLGPARHGRRRGRRAFRVRPAPRRPRRHGRRASTRSGCARRRRRGSTAARRSSAPASTYLIVSTQNHFAMEGRHPGPRGRRRGVPRRIRRSRSPSWATHAPAADADALPADHPQ